MGAGVLLDKLNINWNKGQSKDQDTESAPCYQVFDGDRINDYYFTLIEKSAALEAA